MDYLYASRNKHMVRYDCIGLDRRNNSSLPPLPLGGAATDFLGN
jgi:hypothetical protein